ncbi:MAG: ion transporter, partial [Alphaproteobacteria bacterium]|nr:ion transporter [Alphaproteobacteria bacterium]
MDQTSTSPTADHRARLRAFVESPRFRYPVLALIFVNAVTLGLETSDTVMSAVGTYLVLLDRAILGVFVLELVVRI